MIKVEFKKIRTSIFELKDAFESGKLYMKWGESYSLIETERALKQASIKDNVFVRNKRKLTVEELLKEHGFNAFDGHIEFKGAGDLVVHVSFDDVIKAASILALKINPVKVGMMEYVKC